MRAYFSYFILYYGVYTYICVDKILLSWYMCNRVCVFMDVIRVSVCIVAALCFLPCIGYWFLSADFDRRFAYYRDVRLDPCIGTIDYT